MRDSVIPMLIVIGLAGTVAGCGADQQLSTGSLFGGPKAEAAPAPVAKPATAADRAIYAAATSARAQRCAFYFDAEQLRQTYLSAEAQAGTTPEEIAKATQQYDYTRKAVAGRIAGDEGYCTEGRAREVKAALTRNLAGDFTPPVQRPTGGGLFDNMNEGKSREVFAPEKVFDPNRKSVTKRAED